MIYGFDTDDQSAATAALLVYAIYRSRDRKRYKVTPDMWAQIERFAKASAKRATTLPAWIEAFKPRLSCATISPRWMEVGIKGVAAIDIGRGGVPTMVQMADAREFLTAPINAADHRLALERLYKETAWVVLLVRDRLEREKPLEGKYESAINDQEDFTNV